MWRCSFARRKYRAQNCREALQYVTSLNMRKWMQDKLKRRKKSEEAAAGQPAPLQPAYFEAGQQPDTKATERAEENFEPASESAVEPAEAQPEAADDGDQGEAAAAEGTAPSEGSGDLRRPRRRRRGGRGRRRPGPKPAMVPADQTPVKPSVADESPEPATASPVASTTAPVAQRPRVSKGTVVLAIGLPGSGKSSWFKRHNLSPLSSDMIRAMLFDNPDEQRFQDLVFSNLRSMLRARLVARMPLNYLDATNLTPHDRHSWIKLAKDFGYEVQAVYFDVPLDVCLERNQRRDRVVGEDIMRKMAAKLKAPTFDEGFSKITVVRVKAKE
jgi:predicted kinase